MMTNWTGKRVLILGAARQGLAAARWLTRHGAVVTLNDHRPPEQMAAARQALTDTPVTWLLGSHPLDVLNSMDILCISGGVPLNNPLAAEAVSRGLPLTNDTQIFMEVVPCFTAGITGSAGKTTTTTLVGSMAKAAMGEQAFTGGNIGDPLLNYVDDMTKENLAILEISSFQLEQMTLSPNLAAVLNITPNHLDRHGTMEAYTAAKKRILDYQSNTDIAVLCRDDAGSWALHSGTHGRLLSFGFSPLPRGMDGTYLAQGSLHLRRHAEDIPLMRAEDLHLRGDHNMMNVLAAFAIGSACGLKPDPMLKAAHEFTGVPHRLEFVREWHGAQWYNDSIATAPERTMAAVRSFTEPIILLLGGRDKDLPWQDLAALVRDRVSHVVLFGEAAGKIQAALEPEQGPYTLEHCQGLEQAVQSAAKLAAEGDVVLLSPGGTSFDQFRDFEERGEAYRKWVLELT
jgi:UDP-N-acetylmuramoylalanine--D-glutamate ligase